jgi:hypothetical protein
MFFNAVIMREGKIPCDLPDHNHAGEIRSMGYNPDPLALKLAREECTTR